MGFLLTLSESLWNLVVPFQENQKFDMVPRYPFIESFPFQLLQPPKYYFVKTDLGFSTF